MHQQVHDQALWHVELGVAPEEHPEAHEAKAAELKQDVNWLTSPKQPVAYLQRKQKRKCSERNPVNGVHHHRICQQELVRDFFVRNAERQVV